VPGRAGLGPGQPPPTATRATARAPAKETTAEPAFQKSRAGLGSEASSVAALRHSAPTISSTRRPGSCARPKACHAREKKGHRRPPAPGERRLRSSGARTENPRDVLRLAQGPPITPRMPTATIQNRRAAQRVVRCALSQAGKWFLPCPIRRRGTSVWPRIRGNARKPGAPGACARRRKARGRSNPETPNAMRPRSASAIPKASVDRRLGRFACWRGAGGHPHQGTRLSSAWHPDLSELHPRPNGRAAGTSGAECAADGRRADRLRSSAPETGPGTGSRKKHEAVDAESTRGKRAAAGARRQHGRNQINAGKAPSRRGGRRDQKPRRHAAARGAKATRPSQRRAGPRKRGNSAGKRAARRCS